MLCDFVLCCLVKKGYIVEEYFANGYLMVGAEQSDVVKYFLI